MNKEEIIEKLKQRYCADDLVYIGLIEVQQIKRIKKKHMLKIKFKDKIKNASVFFCISNRIIPSPKKGEEYHLTLDGQFIDMFDRLISSYSLDDLGKKHFNLYCDEEMNQLILE